jgi:hypothetical protein
VIFDFDPSEGIPSLTRWLAALQPDGRDLLKKTIDKMFREGAFQGKRGDVLTIMSFAHVPKHKVQHWKPHVIVLGKRNRIVKERGI